MILSTRLSVRIADLYFDEPFPAGTGADVVRYNQFSKSVPGARCTPFSTIVIDLSRSPDELLAKMKSHTRYKIRRAGEKDELTYEFSSDGDQAAVIRLADHFDRCAGLKHLSKASRPRLRILARDNALAVSFVCDKAGEILAASSYILTQWRARGLYAGASYRQTNDPTRRTLIGRANRYLYWNDMLRLKQAGLRLFDFGGWYSGAEDQEKLRVNGFKEEFGGEVVYGFNCEEARSLKGKVMLSALGLRARWEERRSSARAADPAATSEAHEGSIPASV
jgi:lipid II:glycine glycyltransferase (peptidoglycan interpeptide bridge formation enzyme)